MINNITLNDETLKSCLALDIWSVGCVMAELLIGTPIFPGNNDVDQMVQIIKILGSPTREEVISLNDKVSDFRFPHIKSPSWSHVCI